MRTVTGKISSFGGSHDTGVSPTETLALYPDVLARRLDRLIYVQYYCAMRWDYHGIQVALGTTRAKALSWLRQQLILVTAHGRTCACLPADYGPARSTGRLIDCGPQVLEALGVETDELVAVALPDECKLLG